jgi:hypothetical protein
MVLTDNGSNYNFQLYDSVKAINIHSAETISWIFFVVVYGSGVWTQGLMLARQVIYNLSHSPSLFCSLDHDPPLFASPHSWNDRHELLHPVIVWGGVWKTFCSSWASILPVSASQVARIIGLSHCAWTTLNFKLWSFPGLVMHGVWYSLAMLGRGSERQHLVGQVIKRAYNPYSMEYCVTKLWYLTG